MRHAQKSNAYWIASASPEDRATFLQALDRHALQALPYLFSFWALDHQLPPEGDWRTWVIMGGRGSGKTRAGAEWVRAQMEGPLPRRPGRARRMALLGETFDQVRDVMIFGDSGILAVSPPAFRPEWQATRRRLLWPNGGEAQAFSAHDYEGLRGPQFDACWADELAKWRQGEAAWDMLQFALRLGEDPRACVTTTPRNVPVLKRLLAASSSVVTHAPTEANRANLARGFLEEVRARYHGSLLGQQELDGVLLDDVEGALWTTETIGAAQRREGPDSFHRIVVAVDPPVTGRDSSDECGIIVAGVIQDGPPQDWTGWVLEDATVAAASPTVWAGAAADAVRRHKADRLVAEVNQGGDLVATVIMQVAPDIPYKAVRATRGKVVRAEPVAALYEQGRVRHLGDLSGLEAQMRQMARTGYAGKGSPDRVDALVWALTELMISGVAQGAPRVRTLL